MTSARLATVRSYLKANEDRDWDAVRGFLSPDYVYIDHGTNVTARTNEDFAEALADTIALSATTYEIERSHETKGGTVVVQAVQSCNVSGGPWRSMEATGQRISFPICMVLSFDGDGGIHQEEAYYDMQTVRRQLGY
jgi:steroid delta-isomerase-like uncharacterized protein